MQNNTNKNTNNSSSSSSSPIPMLHIEERTKRYCDVTSKSGRVHSKKFYDVDWRFYVMHKYGKYVVCGTRCPMREYYNEEWPVISASFTHKDELFDYIYLLVGSNKINMTLFISRLCGGDNDITFSQPTNARFRALDAERKDRHNEIVGYDRISLFNKKWSSGSTINSVFRIMSDLNCGGLVPFTVSPHPSQQQQQPQPPAVKQAPICNLPELYNINNCCNIGYNWCNNAKYNDDASKQRGATDAATATVTDASADATDVTVTAADGFDRYDDCYDYLVNDYDTTYAEVD
jgi:hypothetical protein